MPRFYEFFAGGGMARAGLGRGWRCLFANDIDRKKAAVYAANWGAGSLKVASVADLRSRDLPGAPDLCWASFPCQDLSLAGTRAGLSGERSGCFWPFWRLMLALASEGRAPATVVLENVPGALASHGGRDFAAIGEALAAGGYDFGAVVIDAALFVPQSRPRLFVVAARHCQVARGGPHPRWHPPSLLRAYDALTPAVKRQWIWWSLPAPAARKADLADLLEDGERVLWHTPAQTKHILGLMDPANLRKVDEARARHGRSIGAVYRRTRACVQRAEVRFDGIAGCLRTPAGGSSRQTLLIVENGEVRSRLLTAREAARLMGLPDTYKLPATYNDAYHLAGDGVVLPAVRFLARHLLEPVLVHRGDAVEAAAVE